MSADDPNDTSYALKVGGTDSDMWLARSGNDLYLTDSDNSAAQLDIDAVFFDTALAETGDYSDYRIKFNDEATKCVGWTRSIGNEAEYDVEGSVFEPIGKLFAPDTFCQLLNYVNYFMTHIMHILCRL